MPGMIQLDVLIVELDKAIFLLDKGSEWGAYLMVKRVVDSLLPLTCTSTDDSPLDVPEDSLSISREIEDSVERDSLISRGKIGRKINLVGLAQDLDKLRSEMLDKKDYSFARRELSEIVADLKLRQVSQDSISRYDDSGKLGDIILKARTEAKRKSEVIISDKFAGLIVSHAKCVELVDKYIDIAYGLGRDEAEQDLVKNKL